MLLASCIDNSKEIIIINDNFIDIPIVLVFPSEEYKEKYEQTMLDKIELANVIYKDSGIYFYVVDSTINTEYDTNFQLNDESKNYFSQFYNRAIPLFIVDSVKNRKGKYFSAYAVVNGNCRKFAVFRYPDLSSNTMIAHELGHLFGLSHISIPNNIMEERIDDSNTYLTKTQSEKVRNEGEKFFSHCVLNIV